MKKKFFLLLLSCIFLKAEEYENLQLDKAIEIVKNQNLEIGISKFDEKISDFELTISQSRHLGKLDFTQSIANSDDAGNVFGYKLKNREASFNDFGVREYNPSDPSIKPRDLNYPDAQTFYQQKLTYELPLYTGGKLSNYDEIMRSLKKLSTINKEEIIAEKIYEVKKSFYDISLLDSSHQNLSIIRENIEKLEGTVKAMIEEGYAKNIDLLEVQAKKANIVRTINQIEKNRDLAYQFLDFLLDAKVGSIKEGYNIPPMCDLPDNMLEENFDVKKARKQLDISKNLIEIEKSAYKPEIGFMGEYQVSDDKFGMDYANNHSYTVGLQLKFNLFEGFVTGTKIEQAKLKNMKARQQLELAQKGVKLKISKILTEIKNYNFHINSLEDEIRLNKTIYENYLGRYKEKLVSINDVIIKQTQEIESILKLKEVENKRNQKIFELEKIVNKGNLL